MNSLTQIDLRSRLIMLAMIAGTAVSLPVGASSVLLLLICFLGVFARRLEIRFILSRLAALEGFLIVLLILLPFTTPTSSEQDVLTKIWGFTATWSGFWHAIGILLKANTVLLASLALIQGESSAALSQALRGLGLPQNLCILIGLTGRYIDLIGKELNSSRDALALRCFRPGMNTHTLRTYGYLIGMSLVRAYERSERLMSAMLCRGFDGKFHPLNLNKFQRRDAWMLFVCCTLCLFLHAYGWINA